MSCRIFETASSVIASYSDLSIIKAIEPHVIEKKNVKWMICFQPVVSKWPPISHKAGFMLP
jgi:hypothetical protein